VPGLGISIKDTKENKADNSSRFMELAFLRGEGDKP
jgi:hypothetical protein